MNTRALHQPSRIDRLSRFALASLAVHLLVMLVMLVDLPRSQPEIEPQPPAIIIELAELDDVTTITKPADRPPSPAPIPRPPSRPQPAPTPPPPAPIEPPQPPEPPQPNEVIPPPRPPEPIPEMPTPTPPVEPTPPPPEPTPPPPEPAPVPPPRPRPPPRPPRPDTSQQFQNLLGDLASETEEPDELEEVPESPAPSPNSTYAEASGQIADRLTMSEADLLRQKISSYWSMDNGRLGAEKLIIDLQVTVAPDMTVLNIEILDRGQYYANPYYRAATDEAIKAIQAAQPLPLSEGGYERWKTLRLRFDPRSMTL